MPEKTNEPQTVFKILIEGTIEEVWKEITRTDAPIACFFNSRMDVGTLREGSKIAMRSPDGKYTGVVGEILEFSPPRRFSHTFKFTNLDDPPCSVVYTLEPVDGGVEFTLELLNLPVGTKSGKQMVQGAPMIVNTLKAVIETGRPPLGTRLLFVLFKYLQFLNPKRSLSENWPID